jgi:tetratricopeptide (TPR) repeat protein
MEVKAWIEQVIIPTYNTGKPEKNPMFLEKRVYQGSSGVVYPHPVIEKIEDEKKDKEYTAVFIENDYLRIMILPELGGRIQRAYDKVRQRDFVYYNQVIKPALVGLAGPWISGGIEFNWPQHHRPSTFSPVDYTIKENNDGSKTVWVNEIEVMFRTKGMAGFTLYPDKAYLEISGKLFNPTPFPQTFLWWANPAVKVNEHYQSIFPPDVYAVFDHGKRDVSDFPIATGTYYKVDYAPGTDISRYENIPVPTSYMAIQSKYNFMGCYEHDTKGGMLHVADHHFSPGKKQWTWGNGDFGFAWDRNLTDEDGPYIELMTGVFTDNQPDFSWLLPNEGKTFEQYFMPYAEIGAVKNATKEAMVNLEDNGSTISVKVFVTAVYKNAKIHILTDGKPMQPFTVDLAPDKVFNHEIEITHADKNIFGVIVEDDKGNELVAFKPEPLIDNKIPEAATPAKAPADIEHIEELFLNGQHLEQYRHATYNPMDYYEEGLRRSPEDIRCNNAIGLLLMRRGQFNKAEFFFRTAIKTSTRRNPNPYDGEPYFNLGLCLNFQGRADEAYDAFYKATWNDAFQHSAFLELARIASTQNKFSLALSLAEKSLIRNYHSPATRHLNVILLRMNDKLTEAMSFALESQQIDNFNFGCLFEQYFIAQSLNDDTASQVLTQFKTLMRDDINNYLELSLSYGKAGRYDDAINVLELLESDAAQRSPMMQYYKGWFLNKSGNSAKGLKSYLNAADLDTAYCFPNKLEELLILQDAIKTNPADAKAHYYLGNLWYDKRQYHEAIASWEKSVEIDPNFPTVHRNLSLAYYNKLNQPELALVSMEKAFSLDQTDARILMELDQLYKITGKDFTSRLEFLEKYPTLVDGRDDLYLEKITLLNNLGRFQEAQKLIGNRQFHPWEGGEGKVLGQFLLCHIEQAKTAILNRSFQEAIELLNAVDVYPENLGEGKLYGTPVNDIQYLLGCAYEGLGHKKEATIAFNRATLGNNEPVQAIYYNDPQPDKILYQALAWNKLGQPEKARKIFERFIAFGKVHMDDEVKIEYFAVSLPDMLVFERDVKEMNKVFCIYLIGLGYLGLGEQQKGTVYLKEVLQLDNNHQGAAIHLNMNDFFEHGKEYVR